MASHKMRMTLCTTYFGVGKKSHSQRTFSYSKRVDEGSDEGKDRPWCGGCDEGVAGIVEDRGGDVSDVYTAHDLQAAEHQYHNSQWSKDTLCT